MTQEAQDQPVRDAEVALPRQQCAADSADHALQRDTAPRVRLRVKEDLHMDHALLMGTAKVGGGEGVEVGRVAQQVGAGVIDVQKRLQVGEPIRLPHRLDAGIRQRDAMFGRQFERHFRFQRTLDVQVQLRLGEPHDEILHGDGHGHRLAATRRQCSFSRGRSMRAT